MQVEHSEARNRVNRILLEVALWHRKVQTRHRHALPGDIRQALATFPDLLVFRAIKEKLIPELMCFLDTHRLFMPTVWQELRAIFQRKRDHLIRETEAFLDALGRNQVPALVIKGLDILSRVDARSSERVLVDADILVPAALVGAAGAVLRARGYVQGKIDPCSYTISDWGVDELKAMESRHYELAPFLKLVRAPWPASELNVLAGALYPGYLIRIDDKALEFFSCFDIHHTIASGVEAVDLWAGAHALGKGPLQTARVMPIATSTWIIASRNYYEIADLGRPGIRPFCDFVAMFMMMDRNDIVSLLQLSSKYQTDHCIFAHIEYACAECPAFNERRAALFPSDEWSELSVRSSSFPALKL